MCKWEEKNWFCHKKCWGHAGWVTLSSLLPVEDRAMSLKQDLGGSQRPPCLAVPPQGSGVGSGMGRGASKGGFYELAQGKWPGTPEHWPGASTTLLHLLGDPLACQEITQQLNTLYAELVY